MKSPPLTEPPAARYAAFAAATALAWAVTAPLDSIAAQSPSGAPAPAPPRAVAVEEVTRLAREVRDKGWIAFSAPTDDGGWDLHLMRPDGSHRRPLTLTPEWNEFWPQFSRDGTRLLYRRLRHAERVNGNRYGTQGWPMLADADGSRPRELGGEGDLPWAAWTPDGTGFVTLSPKGIAFVDATTGKVRRTLPRQGFFQQLSCSPDGNWLVGVANNFASGWSIARLDLATGKVNAVNTIDCCTPDWFPDSRAVIFSWRPPGQGTNRGQGWTQIWRAEAEGQNPRLVYAKDDRHAYGSFVSPDSKYVLLTGNVEEDGDPGHGGGPMSLIRLADAPIIEGASPAVRARHPEARSGPVLPLPVGWEPSWTFGEYPGNTTPTDHPR